MPGYNTNLGFTIGGYDWEPANPTIDPNRPIYQTQRGNAGLLSDKAYDELSADFAGGLLGRGGYQVNQPAPTDGTYQGNYFVPNQTTGIYSASGENPDNVYNGGGNGLAGDYTFREMLTRQMSAATPWRYKQIYGQDYHRGGDWASLAFADPAMLKNDKARENYDAHWADVLGANPAIMDEVYDPTNAAQGELMDRLLQDQQRKIANDKMDSGIWGHGGGDGSGN